MKKKIAIYVRNEEKNPSGYYRIIQYVDRMNYDVNVHSMTSNILYERSLNSSSTLVKLICKIILYIQISLRAFVYLLKDMSNKVDCILVQREIVPKYMLGIVFLLEKLVFSKTKVIWDFDDEIFFSGEISKREKKLLIKYSDAIIVNNERLRGILPEKVRGKTRLLPTTDGDVYRAFSGDMISKRLDLFDEEISLVWVGTSGNLVQLENIISELDEFSKLLLNKKVVLNIVSGRELYMETEKIILKNVMWSREAAVNTILNSHIGLMPLEDNEFNRGKGGFKLIQYLSGAVPVLGSAVGVNNDIISSEVGYLVQTQGEWKKYLMTLANSKELYTEKSKNALERWKKMYSYEHVLESLNEIVDKLLEDRI